MYIRTTSAGANWYGATLSEISSNPLTLQYFTEKQSRDAAKGLTTVVFDEEKDQLRWCTQFESADTLHIEGAINPKTGNLFLRTSAVLTLEQRQAAVAARKAASNTTTVRKPVVSAEDAEL